MKFHLFAGDDYYPAGGTGDYRGSFPTVEAAKTARDALGYTGWAEIVIVNSEGSLTRLEVWTCSEWVPA